MIYISRPGDSIMDIVLSHYGPTHYAQNYDRVLRANYHHLEYFFPNTFAAYPLYNFEAIELPEDGYSDEAEVVQRLNSASTTQRAAIRWLADAGMDPADLLVAVQAAIPLSATTKTDGSADKILEISKSFTESFISQTNDHIRKNAEYFTKCYEEMNALAKAYHQAPGPQKGLLKPQLKETYHRLLGAHASRAIALKAYKKDLPSFTRLRKDMNKVGFKGLKLKQAEEILEIFKCTKLIYLALLALGLWENSKKTFAAYKAQDDWMREAFKDFGGTYLGGHVGGKLATRIIIPRIVLLFPECRAPVMLILLIKAAVDVATSEAFTDFLGKTWDRMKAGLLQVEKGIKPYV